MSIGLRHPARGYDFKNWTDLPRNIVPIDLDCWLESRGKILGFEFKIGEELVSAGQMRALISLSKKPKCIIFVARNAGEYNTGMNAYEVVIDALAQVTPDLRNFEETVGSDNKLYYRPKYKPYKWVTVLNFVRTFLLTN